MSRSLVIVVAVATLAAAAAFEGMLTNRWGDSEDIRAAAAKLDAVPAEVGSWVGTDSPIDPKILRVAEASGNVSRVYRNKSTGAMISVLILCGPAGPIGAHTPDICYAGAGYEMVGRPAKRSLALPGLAAGYWAATFAKEAGNEPPLEVCWAWGVDGDWQPAEAPRREYALRAALYKFYASRHTTPADRTAKADPIADFLTVFLPEVKKALAPNPG